VGELPNGLDVASAGEDRWQQQDYHKQQVFTLTGRTKFI